MHGLSAMQDPISRVRREFCALIDSQMAAKTLMKYPSLDFAINPFTGRMKKIEKGSIRRDATSRQMSVVQGPAMHRICYPSHSVWD